MAGWTSKQRQIAGMACKHAGLDDAARKLVLRQFPNALLPGSKEPSSTSEMLTQRDFERFMAIVEDRAGGHLRGFTSGYWQEKAGLRSQVASERMAAKIRALYADYQAQPPEVDGGRYRLDGLVYRMSGQTTSAPEEMTPKDAWNLIEMLKALIARRGEPQPPKPRDRQPRLFSNLDPVGATSAGAGFQVVEADEIPF